MKLASVFVALFLVIPSSAVLVHRKAPGVAGGNNPITRVTNLLKELAAKVEKDTKAEEDAYKKFSCWCQTTKAEKEAAVKDAQSVIDAKKAYQDDLANGRVELTTDRADREKQIQQLFNELEAMIAARAKGKADYDKANADMITARDALQDAVNVLGDATNCPGGVSLAQDKPAFLKMRVATQTGATMQQFQAEATSLAHAVQLGHKYLSKADAQFLSDLLTGTVPDVDWKKLNRKGEFKEKYSARSCKIQKVLVGLLQKFTANIKEADAAEGKAVETHEKLKGDKDDQLTKEKQSLANLELENAERGNSGADAQAEIDAAEKSKLADEGFLQKASASCTAKATEWATRKKIRQDELTAINGAIEKLHSDSARDLFKKSFSSQGFSFVQLRRAESHVQRGQDAAEVLRRVVKATGDSRLASLIMLVQNLRQRTTPDEALAPVIQTIDNLVEGLHGEQAKDLKNKETCEQERMDNTRAALEQSRAIDDNTAEMTKLSGEIEALQTSIANLKSKILADGKEREDMGKQRLADHNQWQLNDADDNAAAQLVDEAINILKSFYVERGAQEDVAETPEGAPETWGKTYEGSTKLEGGVVAIMEMAKADIIKDRDAADQEEKDADVAWQTADEALGKIMTADGEAVVAQEKEEGEKTVKRGQEKDARTSKNGELQGTMDLIRQAAPGCNYLTINYDMRTKNRNTEIDGLVKAKAILKGASFN